MKTSTKLLLSALVVLIIAIGIYNSALKAEYLTGNYKKPYRNYKQVDIKGFTEVEINASKMIDVVFRKGDFAVYRSNYSEDTVRLTKTGNKLIVNVDLNALPENNIAYNGIEDRHEYRGNRIIIVCPSLSMLKTTNVFLVNGRAPVNYNFDKYAPYAHCTVEIGKFNLDSLTLVQGGNSQVNLSGNTIGALKVNADHFSSIKIEADNKINSADLQINGKGELWLNNISFPKLTQHISDSARVTLYGASVKNLIKQ
jgi:hypothetical protein